MNNKSLELLEKFVGKNYTQQAAQSLASNENEIRILLEHVSINKSRFFMIKFTAIYEFFIRLFPIIFLV